MNTEIAFNERIKGCLLGAAIGAELGWDRYVHPESFRTSTIAKDVWGLELGRDEEGRLGPPDAGLFRAGSNRIWGTKAVPLIALGVRAYVNKGGRVTPEDFGRELASDADIAYPAFILDALHTNQELLKEGIQPRIGGLGTAPHGLLVAAMPAVGIYHYGDPEYAYLDGVELASVAQPRLGADWTALAAAAIAAALDPANEPEDVIEIVLRLAYENNKDVFYELNLAVRQSARFRPDDPASDLGWWYHNWGRYDGQRRPNQLADNPLFFVLPLLGPFDGDAQKLLATLLWPEGAWLGANVIINPVLAGAVLGARHGRDVFPAEWRTWADALAEPWYEIEQVVGKRSHQEARILRICDTLAQDTGDGASLLEERIYGCLLASSIGNAMGSSTECMLYWEIDERYPGGVQTVLNPARLEGEDDNQMAMLLAETYLRRDGKPVMARHFGQTWYDRLNRDHFFPLCMGAAYDLIRAGWDPRITGHWSVVTGSTVMCMEPVGIYHVADPTYAEIDATAISYMYQRGTDVIAAAILAATVAEALLPDASVDSVCEAALRASPRGEWKTFDQRSFASPYAYIETCLAVAEKYDDVMAAREELYQKCLLYHPIDPIELLGLSLAMFLVAQGDVRQAAIGGTNIGRDADTIAGRGAMLAGALNGPGGVPAEWMALFKPESLDRIRGNARRLTTLILEKKLGTLQRRQAIAG